MPSIGAIILAAGGSSRMGRTKQLLHIGGQSLVRRTTRAALDAGCRPTVVVTGCDADAVTADIADLPVQTALNPQWSAGIGTSIRSGLSAVLAIKPSIAAVLITLCDQPRLSPQVLADLLACWSTVGKPMAACGYAGTIGPPCCFARSMFDKLSHLADADGAKRLLLADPAMVAILPWPAGAEDLDTDADWRRFCQTDSPPAKSPP